MEQHLCSFQNLSLIDQSLDLETSLLLLRPVVFQLHVLTVTCGIGCSTNPSWSPLEAARQAFTGPQLYFIFWFQNCFLRQHQELFLDTWERGHFSDNFSKQTQAQPLQEGCSMCVQTDRLQQHQQVIMKNQNTKSQPRLWALSPHTPDGLASRPGKKRTSRQGALLSMNSQLLGAVGLGSFRSPHNWLLGGSSQGTCSLQLTYCGQNVTHRH